MQGRFSLSCGQKFHRNYARKQLPASGSDTHNQVFPIYEWNSVHCVCDVKYVTLPRVRCFDNSCFQTNTAVRGPPSLLGVSNSTAVHGPPSLLGVSNSTAVHGPLSLLISQRASATSVSFSFRFMLPHSKSESSVLGITQAMRPERLVLFSRLSRKLLV